VIGSALDKRAFLSSLGVADGSNESISARTPATTGADIDVPPTGPYPYGVPVLGSLSHVVMSPVGAATGTQAPQFE
jgi:hypothetical protein